MRKSGFLLALLATALAACGGGGDENDAFRPPAGGDGGTPPVTISSITLVTSSPTIPSDGSAPAEITAFIRDARNQFVENVPVTFSADGGGLQIVQGTTDTNGIARATLSALTDPTLRTLTVTAIAGGIQETVEVRVAGTKLALQGATSLALQQQSTYTVVLSDASDKGLAGRQVALSSARSNTLSAANVTTDSNGSATFTMTVVNSGNDTITASSLGASIALPVTVNADSFSFVSPAVSPVTEVNLGASQSLTVRWTSSGTPRAGETINFSATRGTVTPASAVTNASGEATVSISATNAGGAVVTASSGASSAQLPLEFVATIPDSIDVQPSIFTLGPGQTSTLVAVVRDAQGNLVKNQNVAFTLDDVTGGTLSVGTAVTDSQGRAQTIYTASNQTSANEGVIVTARVGGSISDSVALTVARREVFISLGTGNEVEEPNTAQYRIEYVVQITDASGNGVPAVPVSMRILSTRYYKGVRATATLPATGWGTAYSILAGCADEDINRNGVLDAGEDNNSSGRIEAGNIATVSSAGITDATGMVLVYVTYPQEYAYYLDVELSASARVQGSEYVRSLNFMLPGSAPDFTSASVSPPGPSSPFGVSATCSDTL